MKKLYSLLVKILISAAIFVFVISKLDFGEKGATFFENFFINLGFIFKNFSRFSYFQVFIFVFILFLIIVFVTLRWFLILRATSFKISFFTALKYSLIGHFFNNVMPSTIGGDFIRGYYLWKDVEERKKKAIFTILLDRVIGGISSVFFLFAGAIYLSPEFPILKYLACLIGVFIVFLILCLFFLKSKFLEKIPLYKKFSDKHILKKVAVLITFYREEKLTVIIGSFFISFLVQGLGISLNFLIIRSISGAEIAFLPFLCVVPIINVIQALPVSFAGWGIGEAAYSIFFKMIGITPEISVSASVVYRLSFLIASLSGLPVYILHKGKKQKSEVRSRKSEM